MVVRVKMRDRGGTRVIFLVLISAVSGIGPLEHHQRRHHHLGAPPQRCLPCSKIGRADARPHGFPLIVGAQETWQISVGDKCLSALTSPTLSLRGGDAGEDVDTEMGGAVVAQEGGEGASAEAKGIRRGRVAEPARIMPSRGAKTGTSMVDEDPQVCSIVA